MKNTARCKRRGVDELLAFFPPLEEFLIHLWASRFEGCLKWKAMVKKSNFRDIESENF